MIGLKRGSVKLVKYDPKWPYSFRKEAKKIKKVFGNDALNIQHVGSTAIPAMMAKPIIDIALLVPSLAKAKTYKNKLTKIGYRIKENDNVKNRIFFTKGPENKRTHYLHIGEIGNGYIEEMILFRDYISKHKLAFKKYVELKKQLSNKYKNQRDIYTKNKAKLINNIIKKAKEI